MSVYEKMILKLYAIPLMLLAASVFAAYFINAIGDALLQNKDFAPFGVKIASFAVWVSGCLLASSLAWGAYSSRRIWMWSQGRSNEPVCHNCGGLVQMNDGRYGFYYRCMACGKTRSLT